MFNVRWKNCISPSGKRLTKSNFELSLSSVKYCLNYLRKNKLSLDKAGIASDFQNPYGIKAKIFNNFKPSDFKEWWKTKIKFNYFTNPNGLK